MTKRLLTTLAGEGGETTAKSWAEAAVARGHAPSAEATTLAAVLAAAYPALRAQIFARPEDVLALSRERLRIARDVRAYRRLAASSIPPGDAEEVRRDLRLFAQRERLRIAARELLGRGDADVDVTAREISDLAQVCIEVALDEAMRWARARWGEPTCGLVVLGMGKLGGRELNVGSDVDLLPFYETDEGEVVPPGGGEGPSLHEFFTRVVQRFTATLEEPTAEGIAWRVDLRLRPEGARGPLVNALAAAERYYETWGRTWERAALVRARPIAGDAALGARILDALSPFVWRRVVDPKIAFEMTSLVQRARHELSDEPERDLKLGTGGIREAEFFVQSLQLVWGGREPRIRHANTLEALRRLRSRGLVTDRESRELETAYMALRRVEHRIQLATGIQTHSLPRGETLETIARSLGHESGHELERELDKIRRRVAQRFASLTREIEPESATSPLEPLFAGLEEGSEALVLTALSEGAAGPDLAASVTPDLARHLLALARRPDHPLGAVTRERHRELAPELLAAIGGAADPEQAARLLVSFFARFASPGAYARALAADRQALRRLVTLFGASAFLGETLASHPELVDTVLFAKGVRSPESAAEDVALEVTAAHQAALHDHDADEEDLFVGALRRAKLRSVVEVGVSELSGELPNRDAARVLTAIADATLEQAVRFALAEKGLDGGLAVIAMGKLGGRELGYGSDLDIFFVHDAAEDDDSRTERYIRAAQRVLRLVSTPHGDGPGYELDTRLRPSGSHGLLVVSLDAFARYHGLSRDGAVASAGSADGWERQALVRARACAGDPRVGAELEALAAKAAYELGPPDTHRVHHLRTRMEHELAREGPGRYDVKLGHGGLVDVEFAVQCLQMKHGADPRVRTQDTGAALSALEACGYLDAATVTILRDGYSFLRRLEQALRIVHGPTKSVIEEGAPGMAALARRMGFRDGPHGSGESALLAQYRAVTRDVRSAYLLVLGEPITDSGTLSWRPT